MPIAIISGPEKAGKTTLTRYMHEVYPGLLHPWKRIEAASEFLDVLKADVEVLRKFRADRGKIQVVGDGEPIRYEVSTPEPLIIWDRSWACETVYSTLLAHTGRVNKVGSGWLAEWTMGRAVQACGTRVIWTGPQWSALAEKRDETDLPVHPMEEQLGYIQYGQSFGWEVYNQSYLYDQSKMDKHDAGHTISHLANYGAYCPVLPPVYCGPWPPKVLFIGDRRNEASIYPMSWLPFTSKWTTQYGRILGAKAFKCGWTNALDFPEDELLNIAQSGELEIVVACGEHAYQWSKHHLARIGREEIVHSYPHPSALYRWARLSVDVPNVESSLQDLVGRVV